MLEFSINTKRIVYEMLCFWHDVCHTFIIIQFKIYPNFLHGALLDLFPKMFMFLYHHGTVPMLEETLNIPFLKIVFL